MQKHHIRRAVPSLIGVLLLAAAAIFLHHEPRVTIAEAAGMLGWSTSR